MKNSISANIWKMYLISGMRLFMVAMPVIVLFYKENGLSITQILLLQSFFSISMLLLEVPSGYFSDRFGRKTAIVVGLIGAFAGWVMYSLSYGFWGFLAAELVMGAGSSFISGADSALIYDTLIADKREKSYKKIEGRNLATANFSEGIAAVIGGFLALISLRFPIYIETVIVFLTIPVALALKEPPRHAADSSGGNIRSLFKILKFSLHEHGEVKWLMIYSAVVAASTMVMVWFVQPFLQLVNWPLALFGVAWAALNISTGLFSVAAARIEEILGRRRSLVSLIALTALGCFLLAFFQSWWALGLFFIFNFVRGVNNPVLLDYINRLIPSESRATILSVKALLARLIFAIFGPVIGFISDSYSLKTAFLWSGVIFLTLGSVALGFLKKHRAL
ncbi:MAG: MFS transporter [bacterium]|nr:MFS transporter [bacterium]